MDIIVININQQLKTKLEEKNNNNKAKTTIPKVQKKKEIWEMLSRCELGSILRQILFILIT